jgi:phage shock protein PspC (stress-responsive transcriptional regulator)
LFRDPDDAKVSGVISGLCHYFGINDPVWLRIAAVILIPLTSGSIILVYLLMAIVVPKANTSAEKLQMKGEPINISTI